MTAHMKSGTADTITWRDFLLGHADQDLLMVTEGKRLYFNNTHVRLHWLDRVSMLLVRQAYIRRKSLALCYPTPSCNLPMLAAAQLLIKDFIQNYPGNLSVLLISSRTEVRDHYLHLQVERELLAGALPLARIRADGDPALIPVPGSLYSQRPRLYHLSRPHLLSASWPKDIDAVIVDHTVPTFDEMTTQIHELAERHGISSVIHICTDPFAAFLEQLARDGVPVWFWDHYGLALDFRQQLTTGDRPAEHPFSVSMRQFQNIAAGIRHHALICRHPAFEAAARRVWDDLGTVQRTFSSRAGLWIRRAIRSAYGTFYTMFQMLVPLPVYEEEARNLWGIRPVSRRIADLEACTPLLRDETPELAEIYWPSLIIDLKEMQDALATANPKYDTLVKQIHEHLEQKKSLTIVCPNRALKRMLQISLRAREGIRVSERTELDKDFLIQLITYKELSALNFSDTLLFPGQFSYGRRQYVLTAAAPEIRYLAYSDEADRIEQQVVTTHKTLSEMASAKHRERVWAQLTPHSSGSQFPATKHQSLNLAIEFIRSEGEKVSRQSVSLARISDLSLWTPFSTPEFDLAQGQDILSSDSEEPLRPSEFAPSGRQTVMVPALRVEFADGFCYAEPDSQMTVLLSATGRTDDRRTDGLRPEDIVIFVDGDQRRRLYDTILERIEHHPAMGSTYILVRYWQQAVREGFFRSGMTYDEFLRRLQERGSKVETSAAIYFWVQGWVLGPRDGEDIRRIGEVLNDQTLVQEWKAINRAVRRVRGLHFSLARKLNRIIVQAGLKGQHPGAADECIDQELNLYLDDFRDSVTVHRVVTIS
ncbi:MAG: hypothetical protein D6681_17730, partial [Calditrichaeota bacterium]